MKSFDIKTKIYFGDDSLDRLSQIESDKVLIISDAFVIKSGLGNLITSRLSQANIPYEIFDQVVPDPPIDKITLGADTFLKCKPDTIVAVGGGSAIDSAKLAKSIVINNIIPIMKSYILLFPVPPNKFGKAVNMKTSIHPNSTKNIIGFLAMFLGFNFLNESLRALFKISLLTNLPFSVFSLINLYSLLILKFKKLSYWSKT